MLDFDDDPHLARPPSPASPGDSWVARLELIRERARAEAAEAEVRSLLGQRDRLLDVACDAAEDRLERDEAIRERDAAMAGADYYAARLGKAEALLITFADLTRNPHASNIARKLGNLIAEVDAFVAEPRRAEDDDR
jgi:hypothetical protein